MRRGVAGRGERLLADYVLKIDSTRIKWNRQHVCSCIYPCSNPCDCLVYQLSKPSPPSLKGAQNLLVWAQDRNGFPASYSVTISIRQGNRLLGSSMEDFGPLNFAKHRVDFALWEPSIGLLKSSSSLHSTLGRKQSVQLIAPSKFRK